MAVSVDTVYQKVLALANKEQRGYVTPLEFNLLANQAQELIFEQYFYDLDQFKRKDTDQTSLSDMQELIENKLTEFTNVLVLAGGTTYPNNYRTGRIFALDVDTNMNYEAKHVEMNEIRKYLGSEFHMMGLRQSPMYHKSNMPGSDVEVYNHEGLLQTGVSCEIITRPERIEWGYDVIASKALYNASRSTDSQLHASEETELVFKILELAGIVINKPGLIQAAAQEDGKKIQQEKI
jgi:hypothetical protein|tara:strand:+ start:171 stop:878 length:708 start_codon:yes stop_codon:yes gene_type:complete